jgi:tRNA(Ser,Leu) C12 N-acetylase TAN1
VVRRVNILRKPSYIVTTKYGKELRAELEIGDSIYELDPEVIIERSRYGGVLLVYTRLGYEEFIKKLIAYPPTAVERVVRVDHCCNVDNIIECVASWMERHSIKYSRVFFGRVGSLGRRRADELQHFLEARKVTDINRFIDVEPVNDNVCFGLLEEDEDRVVESARKRKLNSF